MKRIERNEKRHRDGSGISGAPTFFRDSNVPNIENKDSNSNAPTFVNRDSNNYQSIKPGEELITKS